MVSCIKGLERNLEGWIEGILSNTKFGLCGNHHMRPGYIFDMKDGHKKILEVIVHHGEEGIGGIPEGAQTKSSRCLTAFPSPMDPA